MLSCLGLTLVRFVVFDARRWTVLQRFFVIDAFLLWFRCLTEVVTSLNNPNPRCNNCGIVRCWRLSGDTNRAHVMQVAYAQRRCGRASSGCSSTIP